MPHHENIAAHTGADANTPSKKHDIQDLLRIMAALRDPDTGCPWDIEQNFKTIAPYTVEEAYEVADAIDRGEWDDLGEELGDLLLQVVFHAQMAREQALFDFDTVVDGICRKLIHRHPHVFGDITTRDANAVEDIWNAQKSKEKSHKNTKAEEPLLLDDITRGLPALMRAQKIQKKAIRAKFDWEKLDDVFDKLQEEIGELKDAIKSGKQPHIQDELGDVLFVCGILGCWLKVDAEQALHDSSNKFQRRFNHVERTTRANGKTLQDSTLQELESLWQDAKKQERK